jgi:hypothetical protein
MPPRDAELALRRALSDEIGRLAVAHWRPTVLQLENTDRPVAGPAFLVRCAKAAELVAQSQQRRAQCRPQDAWDLLSRAAALLPARFVRRDPLTGAALALLSPPPPDTPADGASTDDALAVRLARITWSDQFELAALRAKFAHHRMTPRDELIEARIQFERWVAHDPARFYRKRPGARMWDDGVPVDCPRGVMVDFGSRIRQFANPADVSELSTAPWQDIGAHRGLGAAALDRLATWAAPAPWCGRPGTAGLVVPRAALRAWQYAGQWRKDMDALGDHMLV